MIVKKGGVEMARLETAIFDLGVLDVLAQQNSPIHRLDSRTKLITTIIFAGAVISFDKYEISGLTFFFLYPAILMTMANIPMGLLFKKLLVVAPFAFFIGIANPFLDRAVLLNVGPIAVSGGWISFASIMLRFVLTVSVALILIATTGVMGVCLALERLKVPQIMCVQLLLLYRYLFVLIDEATRLVRARALRSFSNRGMGITVTGHMIGYLLLRTLNRARRIYLAMLCRGFDGEIRLLRQMRMGLLDGIYILGWATAFVFMRIYNLPQLVGRWITGLFT